MRLIDNRNILIWSFVAVLLSILLKLKRLFVVATDGQLPGNDDYYRLVAVREWMAGANWFDVGQDRLGAEGVMMHWSRIVDLPIALLIGFFEIFLDPVMAERAALIAWPALTFGVAVAIAMLMARRLGVTAHPGIIAVIAGLSGATLLQFEPGRIDHHNLQIILMALVVYGGIDPQLRRGGILAGISCALSMMIGMEALAMIAVCGLLFAARWIAGDDRDGLRFGGFGVSFALGTAVAFVLSAPPERYGALVCDALSPAYGLPVILAGMGAGFAAEFSGRLASVRQRLGACAGLAVVSVGALLAVAPECIGGPYAALSDGAKEIWLPRIVEAQGLVSYLQSTPEAVIVYVIYPILAVLSAVLVAPHLQDARRWDIAMLVIPIIAMVVLSFLQIRQNQFIGFTALPLLAAAVPVVRGALNKWTARSSPAVQWGVCAVTVLLSAGSLMTYFSAKSDISVANAAPSVQAYASVEGPSQCKDLKAVATLASLPRGRVLGDHNLSGRLISATPHQVLVGPYHRSEQSVLDGMVLLDGTDEEVRAVMTGRSADYLALCLHPASLSAATPDGFLKNLAQNGPPEWLSPVYNDSGVYVFRLAADS